MRVFVVVTKVLRKVRVDRSFFSGLDEGCKGSRNAALEVVFISKSQKQFGFDNRLKN